jgi:hypothetical protein
MELHEIEAAGRRQARVGVAQLRRDQARATWAEARARTARWDPELRRVELEQTLNAVGPAPAAG